jgi:hypothetical protein
MLPWYLDGSAARYCGGPSCELQVVCEWAFGVCSGVVRWRWLVGFVSWWWRVLRVWNLVVWWRWWRSIAIELIVQLFKWRLLLLLLLANDLDGVLELCEPRSLSVYMLPFSFDTLSCGLPANDGFLFSLKALNLLLHLG